METKPTILVGCVGQGVLRSEDGGQSWQRSGLSTGLHLDAIVRSLANHPRRPQVVFAGTDRGLYRSENSGGNWSLVDCPLKDYTVWTITIDPEDPQVMFAGTGTPTPAGIFRSIDGGQSWEERPAGVAKECPNVGVPRVTGIAIDPTDRQSIWMGLEVDGARHSSDGGDTWTRVNGGIQNPDVHNVLVTVGPPTTVFLVVSDEVFTSTDNGASWRSVNIKDTFPMGYPRGITVRSDDPKVVMISIGDFTPGTTGTVMRTKDVGQTWESLKLPVEPNTTMWTVNAPPTDPSLVLAGSRYGYLYLSDDGGDSWTKLKREFSEISSLAAVPA